MDAARGMWVNTGKGGEGTSAIKDALVLGSLAGGGTGDHGLNALLGEQERERVTRSFAPKARQDNMTLLESIKVGVASGGCLPGGAAPRNNVADHVRVCICASVRLSVRLSVCLSVCLDAVQLAVQVDPKCRREPQAQGGATRRATAQAPSLQQPPLASKCRVKPVGCR